MVNALPEMGRAALFELCEWLPAERKTDGARASPLERLRQLALRLSEEWYGYCLDQKRADGCSATNNRTEQAIRRWGTRSGSVRGLKSWAGLNSSFVLCANLEF